jgi:hypothetical protein
MLLRFCGVAVGKGKEVGGGRRKIKCQSSNDKVQMEIWNNGIMEHWNNETMRSCNDGINAKSSNDR